MRSNLDADVIGNLGLITNLCRNTHLTCWKLIKQLKQDHPGSHKADEQKDELDEI